MQMWQFLNCNGTLKRFVCFSLKQIFMFFIFKLIISICCFSAKVTFTFHRNKQFSSRKSLIRLMFQIGAVIFAWMVTQNYAYLTVSLNKFFFDLTDFHVQGRNTTQGLLGVLVQENSAAMVELNCETDFVARNKKFIRKPIHLLINCLAN